MAYYNPDGVIEKEGPKKIKIRFESLEDMKEFADKIGIDLSKSVKTITYDPDNRLDSFFD